MGTGGWTSRSCVEFRSGEGMTDEPDGLMNARLVRNEDPTNHSRARCGGTGIRPSGTCTSARARSFERPHTRATRGAILRMTTTRRVWRGAGNVRTPSPIEDYALIGDRQTAALVSRGRRRSARPARACSRAATPDRSGSTARRLQRPRSPSCTRTPVGTGGLSFAATQPGPAAADRGA